MKEPIEPNKDDCCNSGCNPCIFDVYEQQLKLYTRFLESGETIDDQLENVISQLEYTKFILVESADVCKSHKRLLFKRYKNSDGKKICWKPGDHFLLKYNSEDNPCTRAYTPVLHENKDIDFDFCIILRVYEHGLVSNYLNNLQIGDDTLWRGPYGSYKIVPNQFERIIMIAQGTGIAPFMSIIETILNNEDEMTKLELYYCAMDEESILFRDNLYNFSHYWNFFYRIFLGKCSISFKSKYKEPVLNRKLQWEHLNLLKPFTPTDQILLCGCPEFMKMFENLLRLENGELINIFLF